MTFLTIRTWLLAACSAMVLVPGHTWAAGFPDKPVTVVSPFAAGGSDAYLRLIAPMLSEQLGQTIVIQNLPGAGGTLGAERVARAQPDGCTLLFAPSSVLVTGYFRPKGTNVDTLKTFTPLSALHDSPQVLFVHQSLPVNSVAELISYAKSHPTELSYGSSGVGSIMQFNGESFKTEAGVDLLHVPFKGISEMMNDTLAGRIPVGFSTLTTVYPHSKEGKLKILAVLGPARLPFLPDVPSIVETLAGFKDAGAWSGIVAPKGLPADVQRRLHRAITTALAAPEVKAAFEKNFAETIPSSPEELANRIRTEQAQMAKIIKASGIQLD